MLRGLVIIPYTELFPPKNGGQLRCFYLLRELSRAHAITLIVLQHAEQLNGIRHGLEFPRNIAVYSVQEASPEHGSVARVKDALRYRWLRRSFRGPASSFLLDASKTISYVARQQPFDFVLLEHLASMAASPLIRRLQPRAVQILDQHNIDSKLSRLEDQGLCNRILKVESSLYKEVDAFLACSEADRDELLEMNCGRLPGFVVPNGVDGSVKVFHAHKSSDALKTILFCGSLDYGPNRRGIEWFRTQVWPELRGQLPSLRLRVVGRGAVHDEYEELRADPSVEFVGEVDDVRRHYQETGVAIVPLLDGSGTRLKILEAMSLGNPVVSTTAGAEGIGARHGQEIVIADKPRDFARSILRLVNDCSAFEEIRVAGRHIVEQRYDWTVVGRELNVAIEKLVRLRNGIGPVTQWQ